MRVRRRPRRLTAQDDHRRTHVRQELLIQSGIALAAMSLLSLGLGWLVAGRVLQPLEDSYEAQRQFVANASHELRAPLTRQRALIEVALASPEADSPRCETAHERVLASEQHLEQLIDALLALTRGQAGLERRERLDLATLTSEALLARESELAGLDLDVRATLDPAPTPGDPRLLERLIDQPDRQRDPPQHPRGACRDHHRDPRPARVRVDREHRPDASRPRRSSVSSNPSNDLAAPAPRHNNGHGLGLSIVQAIANAHGADLDAHARPAGRAHHRGLIPGGDRRRLRAEVRHRPDEARRCAHESSGLMLS